MTIPLTLLTEPKATRNPAPVLPADDGVPLVPTDDTPEPLAPDPPLAPVVTVMTRLRLTALDDTTPVLIPACLAHRAARQATLATELAGLRSTQTIEEERLAEIYSRAKDRAQADDASADLREEIAVRATHIAKLEIEETALEAGRGTLQAARFTVSYDLHDLVAESDTSDSVTNDERAALVLRDNPIIVRLQEASDPTATTRSKGLLGWHAEINARARRVHPTFGRFIASPWLIAVAVVLVLLAFSAYSTARHAPSSLTPDALTPAATGTPTSPAPSPALALFTPPVSPGHPAQAANIVAYFPAALQTDPQPDAATSTPTGPDQPHGPFLPPSQLAIPAFNLTLPIDRARTQETYDGAGQPQAAILPPSAGELTHFGAYPGETGTLWLFGSETTLSRLRTMQEKDQLVITDRTGTTYTYSLLPFSPSGQPERLIDLNSDTWLFNAPSDVATLTILLPLPQTSRTPSTGQGAGDDYSISLRFAYRAALQRIAPATATPSGTPVFIPNTLYTPQPAMATPTPSVTHPTPASAAHTPTQPTPRPGAPTPTPALPGFPNTGGAFAPSPLSAHSLLYHTAAS